VLGHFRFIFEAVGPELRQYIVTDNDAERPFSRDQRRWIYATSKGQDNRFAFGTDNDLDRATNHLIVRPAAFPPPGLEPTVGGRVPVAKVLGGARDRRKAFRPQSIVNVSGMSWGALSGPAIESLNRGAADAGALHCTGEGGISNHHRHGGDLIFQIGSGYFGCRDARGRFDLAKLVDLCEANPVKALEIKLSQGAKPGVGGLLPAGKVTSEVARVRGVPAGVDCASPPYHSEFSDEDSMLDFVERLADATGLPVGIKSAVGDAAFWTRLASLMKPGDRGVDFIVIDGGEGGTGAAPLVFTDHVAMPFMGGFAEVSRVFGLAGIHDRVVFVGSGRLGWLCDNGM
jgi:glutamate synthase domain-containing protein 2